MIGTVQEMTTLFVPGQCLEGAWRVLRKSLLYNSYTCDETTDKNNIHKKFIS